MIVKDSTGCIMKLEPLLNIEYVMFDEHGNRRRYMIWLEEKGPVVSRE